MSTTEYGQYFKALRESKGLTLRNVEKITDISNAYLSQLESGKVKQPSPNNLYKLSEAYEVPYETLMGKVGYPIPNGGDTSSERSKSAEVSNKLGEISSDEEIELLQYLKFIRNRK
ncbi:helix-turn-helix domain-containing protein [Ekhidna sp.]|jgi:transcriptional regulator with XRE-family HTH domain|uniref:helix-turn-helix domain-containing protein n=1 Tax=Ekhidna sp. TaxID=2608089 RepID=UPI0032ED55E5|tara:strand:+ start:6999 stop:7346 length:348 start_codon:yes stop_codon:yes gene_type:complete